MRHFIDTSEYDRSTLEAILTYAITHRGERSTALAGRAVALIFFDSSLRTRTSFAVGIAQLGGMSVTLEVGRGAWNLEYLDGTVMDGDKPEHVADAARVLSRYFDVLAVRCFPSLKQAAEDQADPVIEAFRRHATVPVVNLESALYHPCQAMADMMTIRERFGRTDGLRVALAWTPHVKALPTAVPNSFALAAVQLGCQLTIVAPPGFSLPETVMARLPGVEVVHDQSVLATQDVVYAKSWTSLENYGAPPPAHYRSWMLTPEKLGRARFLHCMPLRRNVEVTDAVLESAQNDCYDEAENRLHVQKAILLYCLNLI
ncbi:MAG: N-acetylornithine carbamoyltransferase [Chloracidobacterium sp.]|nr:N-acetylornithine carbamoyltransferase [Chloracidobacterium sp.]MDW8218632.1 N-acetylornithine carbamoyltransferase [Acidobacteriota bacterium]